MHKAAVFSLNSQFTHTPKKKGLP